ncbi:nucleotidyltransferase family protein [Nitratifractor sp.]
MQRHDVLRILREQKDYLHRKFGVTHLQLFGSYARDEARSDSDIDLLVEMPGNYEDFFELQRFLEAKTGKPIDLGRKLRPFIARQASKEMIDV